MQNHFKPSVEKSDPLQQATLKYRLVYLKHSWYLIHWWCNGLLLHTINCQSISPTPLLCPPWENPEQEHNTHWDLIVNICVRVIA